MVKCSCLSWMFRACTSRRSVILNVAVAASVVVDVFVVRFPLFVNSCNDAALSVFHNTLILHCVPGLEWYHDVCLAHCLSLTS